MFDFDEGYSNVAIQIDPSAYQSDVFDLFMSLQVDEPEAPTKQEKPRKFTSEAAVEGHRVRVEYVNGERTEVTADWYRLPKLSDITWARFELFYNPPGEHKPTWVIKVFYTTTDCLDEVNPRLTEKAIYFNLFDKKQRNRSITNIKGCPSSRIREFRELESSLESISKDAKDKRPKGQKKNKTAVFDEVLGGFNYLRKKPFKVQAHGDQQAFLLPGDSATESLPTLFITDNHGELLALPMIDVRGKVGNNGTRSEKACVMIGYVDRIGYMEWRKEHLKAKRAQHEKTEG